jgi:hypothetical protein
MKVMCAPFLPLRIPYAESTASRTRMPRTIDYGNLMHRAMRG